MRTSVNSDNYYLNWLEELNIISESKKIFKKLMVRMIVRIRFSNFQGFLAPPRPEITAGSLLSNISAQFPRKIRNNLTILRQNCKIIVDNRKFNNTRKISRKICNFSLIFCERL